MSKILKEIKGSIISYANRRISTGDAYHQCGFVFHHSTAPSYGYTKGLIIESRMKYQKHKLKDMEHYSPDLSEVEIMALNNYHRIWDCGNNVFIREG